MMGITETATRTIEQVLAIRLRAAQLRVLERITALVKEQEVAEQGLRGGRDEADHAKLLDTRLLAEDEVRLVQREIAAQQPGADPVPYLPASTFAVRRYAAILMLDNAELTAETALEQARADERVRFADYYVRMHGDEDELDQDDENQ